MEDGADHATGTSFLETEENNNEPSSRTRSASTGSNGGGISGGGHKRSFSGSLLSRLSFLRMSQVNEENDEKERREVDDADAEEVGSGTCTGAGGGAGGGTSTVIQRRQSLRKTRRRKGSLRKTALLGTGGLRLEGREKRGAASRSLELSAGGAIDHDNGYGSGADGPSELAIDTVSSAATPRPIYESQQQSGWPLQEAQGRQSLNNSSLHEQESLTAGRSFTHHSTTTSSTNNHDIGSLGRLQTNNTTSTSSFSSLSDTPTAGHHVTTPSSSSESYFPLHKDSSSATTTTTSSSMPLRSRAAPPPSSYTHTTHTHHPSHRQKSPLATHHHPVDGGVTNTSEIWDYSETEWWGWIILIVTWLVFVVGMGSCFEVWSWAWDVGETPYAPPELEDDPTLPIVGYYPALIILTAVMAWVWVVVAWVGMKYFRHANISGEDS